MKSIHTVNISWLAASCFITSEILMKDSQSVKGHFVFWFRLNADGGLVFCHVLRSHIKPRNCPVWSIIDSLSSLYPAVVELHLFTYYLQLVQIRAAPYSADAGGENRRATVNVKTASRPGDNKQTITADGCWRPLNVHYSWQNETLQNKQHDGLLQNVTFVLKSPRGWLNQTFRAGRTRLINFKICLRGEKVSGHPVFNRIMAHFYLRNNGCFTSLLGQEQ